MKKNYIAPSSEVVSIFGGRILDDVPMSGPSKGASPQNFDAKKQTGFDLDDSAPDNQGGISWDF